MFIKIKFDVVSNTFEPALHDKPRKIYSQES